MQNKKRYKINIKNDLIKFVIFDVHNVINILLSIIMIITQN